MHSDWLERLFTTCPRHLREMGHLREMLGIRKRWERFGEHWQSHCQQSRALVLEAARRCARRDRAVILGSGWLHDVPLAELASHFAEVTLVDLFHPREIRKQVRSFPNVRLVEADVTGTLEAVHRASSFPRSPLPRVEPGLFVGEKIDLVVSLNLLSQLPCMPEWFLRQARSHDPAAILAFSQGVIRAHLAYLERLPGVVALVTDVALEWVDPDGQARPKGDTLYHCPLPWRGTTWAWNLVPHGPGRRGERLQVVGVADVKRAGSPSGGGLVGGLL